MKTFILGPLDGYELIDSGSEEKLERFGQYTLSRPDPNAVWPKKLSNSTWNNADAIFHKEKLASGKHWENKRVKEPWEFTFGPVRNSPAQGSLERESSGVISNGVKMYLKLTPFKHVGLFPEQILNWEWFGKILEGCGGSRNILNLFGYTGGATLYAASKGAIVTHVDASKPSVNWAIQNQKLSGLSNTQIRWIVDDAIKFVTREIKRGRKYEAVIMDPPAFGRDQKGNVFKFEKDIPQLLKLIKQVLSPRPLFFLFNSYSLGYSSTVIKNMLGEILPIEKIESGELQIKEKSSERCLPCGVFARYKS